MFLILMVIGLVGLAMMAIPAFNRHGHAPGTGHALGQGGHHAGLLGHGHGAGHAAHVGQVGHAGHAAAGHAAVGHAHGGGGAALQLAKGATSAKDAAMDMVAPGGMTRFIPSPRAVFSVLALYGAFGNALAQAAQLPTLLAALAAVVPAILVERFAVTPLWNLLFRFEGAPSAPLETLLFSEAKAVTPFRNGKGLVSFVRDGRLVQLAARLPEAQADKVVKVGDRLLIEDVDASNERLTVSVPE